MLIRNDRSIKMLKKGILHTYSHIRKMAAKVACVPQFVAQMCLQPWSSLGVRQWSPGPARGHYSSWWGAGVWRARGRPCEWWTWCPPLDGSAGRRAARPSRCSSGILCTPVKWRHSKWTSEADDTDAVFKSVFHKRKKLIKKKKHANVNLCHINMKRE